MLMRWEESVSTGTLLVADVHILIIKLVWCYK